MVLPLCYLCCLLYLMKEEKFCSWWELDRHFTLLLNDMVVLLHFYDKLNDANQLTETKLIILFTSSSKIFVLISPRVCLSSWLGEHCFYCKIRDRSFSTYAKFSEKLTFLTPLTSISNYVTQYSWSRSKWQIAILWNWCYVEFQFLTSA